MYVCMCSCLLFKLSCKKYRGVMYSPRRVVRCFSTSGAPSTFRESTSNGVRMRASPRNLDHTTAQTIHIPRSLIQPRPRGVTIQQFEAGRERITSHRTKTANQKKTHHQHTKCIPKIYTNVGKTKRCRHRLFYLGQRNAQLAAAGRLERGQNQATVLLAVVLLYRNKARLMSRIRREVSCFTPRSPRYLRMGWWMNSSGDPSSIRSTDASDRMANSCTPTDRYTDAMGWIGGFLGPTSKHEQNNGNRASVRRFFVSAVKR